MFEHLPEWVHVAAEWMGAEILGACGVLLFAALMAGVILVIKSAWGDSDDEG